MNPSHIEILQSLGLLPKPEEPPKKKRGRPAGSKNEPEEASVENVVEPTKRKRGRPFGSKNKPKVSITEVVTDQNQDGKPGEQI